MPNRRILAAALASLGLAGTAHAQTSGLPRDERMEVENENENEVAREARLAVPRKADGAIDLQALDSEIRAALAGGARDVRVRDRELTAAERQQLADLAQTIGADLNLARVRVREDDARLRIDLRPQRTVRAERVEKPERPERMERAERPERIERVERPERSDRH